MNRLAEMIKDLHQDFIDNRRYSCAEKLEPILKEAEKSGWVPCSERLPSRDECLENDCRFIVTDGNRTYQGLFDTFYREFVMDLLHGLRKADKCVIAWMPLPKPYKESED